MDRGERPIKLGDSWFSPKCIEVQRQAFSIGGRALDGLWGPTALLIPTKLRMPMLQSLAVRPRGVSFVVERETAQTAS